MVRLKGGDPFLFGRGGEEAEALPRPGVPWEVVPGVTSAIAVPAVAGIPVTQRGLSTSVTVVTGQVGDETRPGGVDWESLARANGHAGDPDGDGHPGRDRAAPAGAAGARRTSRWRSSSGGRPPRQRVVRTTLAELESVAARLAGGDRGRARWPPSASVGRPAAAAGPHGRGDPAPAQAGALSRRPSEAGAPG